MINKGEIWKFVLHFRIASFSEELKSFLVYFVETDRNSASAERSVWPSLLLGLLHFN